MTRFPKKKSNNDYKSLLRVKDYVVKLKLRVLLDMQLRL